MAISKDSDRFTIENVGKIPSIKDPLFNKLFCFAYLSGIEEIIKTRGPLRGALKAAHKKRIRTIYAVGYLHYIAKKHNIDMTFALARRMLKAYGVNPGTNCFLSDNFGTTGRKTNNRTRDEERALDIIRNDAESISEGFKQQVKRTEKIIQERDSFDDNDTCA
tara:strand:+ start:691 stop:1179 length:489 start_codon:yes stop_codon:yes gene_type:complete